MNGLRLVHVIIRVFCVCVSVCLSVQPEISRMGGRIAMLLTPSGTRGSHLCITYGSVGDRDKKSWSAKIAFDRLIPSFSGSWSLDCSILHVLIAWCTIRFKGHRSSPSSHCVRIRPTLILHSSLHISQIILTLFSPSFLIVQVSLYTLLFK